MYDLSPETEGLYCLTNMQDQIDYTFPSKIEGNLFCLTQSLDELCGLIVLPWAPIAYQSATTGAAELLPEPYFLLEHDHPLCFLSMQNQQSGFVLELYQKEHPDLVVKPYWPMPAVLPKELDYFVVYQHEFPPSGWQVSLVAKYQEGAGNDYLKLYKIER